MPQSPVSAHVSQVEQAPLEGVPSPLVSSGDQSQAPTEVASPEIVCPESEINNGQSQAPPEVTGPAASEAAPGTDNAAHKPDSVMSKKQQIKRKRLNSKDDRKDKKKPKNSKKSGTSNISDCDPSLSQILGPSLEEMMASDRSHDSLPGTSPTQPVSHSASSPSVPNDEEPTAPVRRRGGTRLTAVKQQLSEALEEMASLKNTIALLETEIDRKNKEIVRIKKCDTTQKSEIKKLTKLVDEQKKELMSYKGTNGNHRAVHSQHSISGNEPVSNSVITELQCIKQQIDKSLSSLSLSVLRESADSDDDGFVPVNRRRPKSTRALSTEAPIAGSSPSAVTPSDPASRRSRVPPSPTGTPGHRAIPGSAQVPSSGSRRMTSPRTNPRIAVVGSSIVRGVGGRLSRRGMDATSFCYPGCEIPLITERISGIFSERYQPETVVLQCGGNDLANHRPTAQVVQQLDILVQEVRRCCPRSIIVVSKIPLRGHDERLLHEIALVNTFISNMARDKRNNIYCCDPSPKMFKYFSKDEVHFNHSGKQVYAYELAKFLANFQWPPLPDTR